MTIEHLIKESRSGDRNAQQMLYKQLSAPMMGVCLRYLKNKEDAEDVLLEGFYKVFKNLGKFVYETDAGFFGWVKRIMINESLMKLRKHRDIHIMAINEEAEQEVELSPLNELEAEDLLKLIRSIPVGYRTVFNLYEVEGYSHQEIAEKLSISIGTSKSQLFKAKKLLKEMLNEKTNEYGS